MQVHTASQLCLAFSTFGLSDKGELALALTSDCSDTGVAIPLIVTKEGRLQNALSPQLCVAPLGGFPSNGTRIVVGPSCVPNVNTTLLFVPMRGEAGAAGTGYAVTRDMLP